MSFVLLALAARVPYNLECTVEALPFELGLGRLELRIGREGVSWRGGSAEVTLRPGFRLLVKRRESRTDVFVDGRRIRSIPCASAGKEAYSVKGRAGGLRIRRLGRILFRDSFARLQGEPSEWGTSAGEFEISPEGALAPFAFRARGAHALALVGRREWDDYAVRACVRAPCRLPAAASAEWWNLRGLDRRGVSGKAGLVFWARSPEEFWALRLGEGRVELLRVEGEREEVVFGRDVRLARGQWYSLACVAVGSTVACYLDDGLLGTASDPNAVGGKVGLVSSTSRGWMEFDDFCAESAGLAERELPGRLSRTPGEESWPGEMSAWAGDGNELAYPMPLWGSASVGCSFLPGTTAVLGFEGAGAVEARIESAKVSLFSGGKAIAEKKSPGRFPRTPRSSGRGGRSARLDIREGRLSLFLDGREAISTRAGPALSGAKAFVRGKGIGEAKVSSPSLRVWRFKGSPWDWRVQAGLWDVLSRWSCAPQHSWFGAKADGLAIVWSKRGFGGDLRLEFDAAAVMASRCTPFYDFPVVFGATICASRPGPSSGYSLLFSPGDMPAVLYRAGRPVARAEKFHRPRFRTDIDQVYEGVHRLWFRLAVENVGGEIRCFLDGEEMLRFRDPEPLTGTMVSLWTVGRNGMMVSRCRVSCAEPGRAPEAALPRERAVGGEHPGCPIEGRVIEASAWTTLGGEQGASVSDEGGQAVLVNSAPGGTFAAEAEANVDLVKEPVMWVALSSSPGARFNLYLDVEGVLYRVELCGGRREESEAVELARATFEPGGGWKVVRLDLLRLLRSFHPRSGSLVLRRVILGNLEGDPALLAGLGGNGPGEEVRVGECVFGTEKLDKEPPGLELTSPRDGVWDGSPVVLAVRDPSGVRPESVRVRCAEKSLVWGDEEVDFRDSLVLDLEAAGVELADGEEAEVALEGVSDGRGNALRKPFRFTVRMDRPRDKRPPRPPEVRFRPFAARRIEPEAWTRLGGLDGAELRRVIAGGRPALRLRNALMGGSFGAALKGPFDARVFPLASFEFLASEECSLNLQLLTEAGWKEIDLLDPTPGAVSGGAVLSDAGGGWRRAEASFIRALRGSQSKVIRTLAFGDRGYAGNPSGSWLVVRDFALCPRARAARFSGVDASGIAGYSALVDRSPLSLPPERPGPDGIEFKGLARGSYYLHVRAVDRCGNWGEPAHVPFYFDGVEDSTPPAVEVISPRPGKVTAAGEIVLRVKDDASGVGPGTLKLVVEGEEYAGPGGSVLFHPSAGLFRARLGSPAFAGRRKVRCVFLAKDYAGNGAEELRWNWTFDPRHDRAAPPPPRVTVLPAERLLLLDFEEGLGRVRNRRGASVFLEEKGGHTGRCARFSNRSRNYLSAYLLDEPFHAGEWGALHFDYRVPPEVRVRLMTQLGGRLAFIPLGGEGERGIVRDGTWHHGQVDLARVLGKRATPGFLATRSAGNNPAGASFLLDNVCLGKTGCRDFEFRWTAPPDATGVAGYSFALDEEPDDDVDARERKALLRSLRPGKHVFRVKALDGAGNWGRAGDVGFVVFE